MGCIWTAEENTSLTDYVESRLNGAWRTLSLVWVLTYWCYHLCPVQVYQGTRLMRAIHLQLCQGRLHCINPYYSLIWYYCWIVRCAMQYILIEAYTNNGNHKNEQQNTWALWYIIVFSLTLQYSLQDILCPYSWHALFISVLLLKQDVMCKWKWTHDLLLC